MKIKTNKGYITQANDFAFHYYSDNSIKDGIRNSPTHINLGLRDYINKSNKNNNSIRDNICKWHNISGYGLFRSFYQPFSGFYRIKNLHILSDLNESVKQYIKFYNKDYKDSQ